VPEGSDLVNRNTSDHAIMRQEIDASPWARRGFAEFAFALESICRRVGASISELAKVRVDQAQDGWFR